jgi:flagellar protein FlaG
MDTSITLRSLAQSGQTTATPVVGASVKQAVDQPRDVESERREASNVAKQDLADAVESINQRFQMTQRALKFSIDETSGRTVITVTDRETDEVIRQIPPAETMAIASRLDAATDSVLLEARA